MGYKTREWRKSMRITLDYNNMTEKFLGKQGFTEGELRAMAPKAKLAFDYVQTNRGKDELYMGWTELPYNQKEIVEDILVTACIITTFLNIREKARNSTWKTTLTP